MNAYIHAFIVMFTKAPKEAKEFSLRVISYSHDCQGLLESPLQLIFTATLICLDVLPTPYEKTREEQQWVLENSFGATLNISFVPLLSIAFSFISIMVNTIQANNIIGAQGLGLRRTLTWILYLSTTILFRVQIWVLLCSFLEFKSLVIFGVIFLFNFLVFNFYEHQLPMDSFLGSFYSLAFPCASLMSILEATETNVNLKKVSCFLTHQARRSNRWSLFSHMVYVRPSVRPRFGKQKHAHC